MNYNDDYNPFADSSIRQATAAAFPNQQAHNDYNPFSNTTTAVQREIPPQYPYVAAAPPQHPNIAAVLPPPPQYQAPTTAPTPPQQPTSTRIDLSQLERQQAELAEREKRITERERTSTDPTKILKREKNFPPLPKICPCGPCFYQDISIEIPSQFQIWVRYLYYLWLAYAVTLFLNMIAALSYFSVDKEGATTFGLSLVYLVLFVPASYVCWFRPIYRAFSGFTLMIKLFTSGGSKIVVGLIVMIVTACFAMLALADGLLMIKKLCLFRTVLNIFFECSGFARIGVMSTNKVVGIMMIILGVLWSLITLVTVLLTIRVHRLYRLSGASLEQAQQEFQSAFVNNETVRGAAREVATAGINDALRPNDNQQRPIY
ncbi:unnamed protein product [Rotaria socialis]|uniref:Secretory carrier-associated membrane protein n=1 Tax=Rotaria socialis TaxID=392032 RepID=A0A818MAD8_9BILA|nr:unnamed protein product [Rotaria socialis]CAF4121579.1 unnamed protein product [Rotaria socialis]CAF4141714.1 unnamed protein product [Rotaria socialis]CAF4295579.1 unnamed protein product [Rotaria socialis]